MGAAIVTFRTRKDRLHAAKADRLRTALQEIEAEIDLPVGLMRDLFVVVEKGTHSCLRWAFVMLSPEQNGAVVNYLVAHSSRPLVAVRLWATCFEHLRTDTGEILLSRQQLAMELDVPANVVSRIMTELEDVGAIIRKREGTNVRYFMNPKVATHLSGRARDTAQKAAPKINTRPTVRGTGLRVL